MNSPEIKALIREHSSLFWYIPEDKKEEISNELLLETILNYGTLANCLHLIEMFGRNNALRVLQNAKGRKKMNYYPEVYNFFNIFLSKNA